MLSIVSPLLSHQCPPSCSRCFCARVPTSFVGSFTPSSGGHQDEIREHLKIVRSEVKLGRPVAIRAPGTGWKTKSKNVEQSLIRLHHEIGSDDPETQRWTSRVPAFNQAGEVQQEVPNKYNTFFFFRTIPRETCYRTSRHPQKAFSRIKDK